MKIIDIFFLVLVMISLFLPTANITKDKIAKGENRYLSEFVQLYDKQSKSINFNFGNDFENYIKDRFWGRIYLIHIEKIIAYFLSHRYVKYGETILDKEKKIMYEHLLADRPKKSNEMLMVEGVKNFNEFCAKNNIKFYPVIMPRKESIYIPDLVIHDKNEEVRKSIDYISEKSGVNIIYTFDDIMKAKETSSYLLYHKTDHHATIDGAFVGYNRIMQEMKKTYPDIKVVTSEDLNYSENRKVNTIGGNGYRNGSTCGYAGILDVICEEFLDVNYRYAKHKDANNLQMTETRNDDIIKYDYFYPYGSDLKVMVFGDSFTPNLMEFLPYSFKNVRYIRLNGPKNIKRNDTCRILRYYEDEIAEFKPDVIIIYVFYSLYAKLRDIATY